MKPWKRQKTSWTDRRYKPKSNIWRRLEEVGPTPSFAPQAETNRATDPRGAQHFCDALRGCSPSNHALCARSPSPEERRPSTGLHLCCRASSDFSWSKSKILTSTSPGGGSYRLAVFRRGVRTKTPLGDEQGSHQLLSLNADAIHGNSDLLQLREHFPFFTLRGSRLCTGCKFSCFNMWAFKKTNKKIK